MAWVQFPFPKCPGCERTWTQAYHRNCSARGAIELDPDVRRVRCDGCGASWNVWDTRFYCACGHEFDANRVEAALQEIIRAARMLAQILDDHRDDVAAIRAQGSSSFRAWLMRVAEGVGGALGQALGRVIGSIFRGLGL